MMTSFARRWSAATALANVYVDISIRQLDYRVNSQGFYRWLRDLIDWATPWKVLFASDTPMPTFWCPEEECIKVIKEPDMDIPFTQEEIDIVMGKAAQLVFNVED